ASARARRGRCAGPWRWSRSAGSPAVPIPDGPRVRPPSPPESACSRPPAASTPAPAAQAAPAGNTATRASAFLVIVRAGPFLCRALVRRIDHFTRAVERVPGAEHRRELLLALLTVGPRRSERAEPALARQRQRGAAFGG